MRETSAHILSNTREKPGRYLRSTAIVLLSIFGTSFHPGTGHAQEAKATPAQATLPDTPVGKTLRSFLTAFNSGDIEIMRRFHREHGGDEANADQDIGFFKQSGGLKVHSVTQSSDSSIEVLVQTLTGDTWLKFSIDVEQTSPHGITSIRVQPASAPTPGTSRGTGSGGPEGARGASAPPAKRSMPETIAEIEGYLKKRAADDQFSGSVLIARNGTPIFEQAYGLANKQYNVVNRVDTRFNLGSINKLFTRIAITQLVDKGQLALSDTIAKHLPDYPNKEAAGKVTIQHLLEMESGIGDFFGPRFEATPKDRVRTISDYLKLFASEPLAFEPGTRRAYSNGGYVVLGAIIEKVTNGTYYDYVREHIYKPAGMEATDSYEVDQSVPNLATGYTRQAANSNGQRISNVYTKPARGSSAGGGYSTAPDLLKFAMAFQGNKLLSASSTRKILGAGLGIAGGAPGINATLEIEPASGYVIVVMSNYDPPAALEVNQQIRSLLDLRD